MAANVARLCSPPSRRIIEDGSTLVAPAEAATRTVCQTKEQVMTEKSSYKTILIFAFAITALVSTALLIPESRISADERKPLESCASAEVERVLQSLRLKLPNKTDDEIIQILRGYVPGDKSAESNGTKWFAERLQYAKKQRDTVAAMHRLKWAVGYDYELDPSGNFISSPTPPAPDLWRKGLGVDFFASVLLVYVMETAPPGVHVDPLPGRQALRDMPDAEVELIQGLRSLKVLDFDDRVITDSIMVCLEGLTQLRTLRFNNSDISRTGLKRIGTLSQLRELSMNETRIADPEMQHLKGLKQLRSLRLDYNGITDAGIECLEGLPQLEELALIEGNKISDAGLEHLRGLHQLEDLNLDGLKITDAGLRCLQGLTRLRKLDLDGTHVTGAGLKYLGGMSQLQELALMDTQVGDVGLVDLRT